jgi:hypothetical protein
MKVHKTNAGLTRTFQVLTKTKYRIATDFCEVLAMTPYLSLQRANEMSDATISVLFPSINKLRQRFFVASLLRKTEKEVKTGILRSKTLLQDNEKMQG